MSDIITTKRQINGEQVSETRQSASPVFYAPTNPPTTVGTFTKAMQDMTAAVAGAEADEAPVVKRSPGRPKGSKTSPEKIGRAQRERDRQRIREERAFEIEREQAERQYEIDKRLAEHTMEIERARQEFEFAQERRRIENQSRRVAPRDPLRAWVLSFTLGLALLILAASAVFSFATIADAAQWLQPSWPWLVWLLPIATEFFIVFGGMDTLISQSRGDKKGARTGLAIMLAASLVAVIANGAHTLSEWEQGAGLDDWRAWVGIGLSALIPIATVVASKRAINLVFAKGV